MKNNKLALVTGSTAGIGFAIAEKLVHQNFDVIINGRSEERVNKAINQLLEKGASKKSLHGVAADLTTVEGIAKVQELFPEVDVLINNFGIFEPKEFANITDADWEKMWNGNFMSGARLSRHYFPRMLKKNYGRVIFISSESALQIPAEMIHYGVSKTAQISLARGMAEVAGESNVTVNSVLVGPTKSEGVGTFLKQLAEKDHLTESDVEKNFFKTARPTSLIKRFIRPEEIGAFVAFLASEESSAITGSALRADGGLVKSII
ncbi:SDR family NAD(P)-dependent oxidoreductase [Bdellovibrio svalbardensis]|uniref:SDR family oxidoreductase n=1 Tax=Bdellovibrio svalbardensis TaxID=2972972 RepID=A0ABT6DGC7_9BACT|nr:SDR family oxidoreductase [Bdellovibrio svalbardensis]MDG0815877.1 SDR family oxidoreductase [Bdellovibrio svalbardensis]